MLWCFLAKGFNLREQLRSWVRGMFTKQKLFQAVHAVFFQLTVPSLNDPVGVQKQAVPGVELEPVCGILNVFHDSQGHQTAGSQLPKPRLLTLGRDAQGQIMPCGSDFHDARGGMQNQIQSGDKAIRSDALVDDPVGLVQHFMRPHGADIHGSHRRLENGHENGCRNILS